MAKFYASVTILLLCFFIGQAEEKSSREFIILPKYVHVLSFPYLVQEKLGYGVDVGIKYAKYYLGLNYSHYSNFQPVGSRIIPQTQLTADEAFEFNSISLKTTYQIIGTPYLELSTGVLMGFNSYDYNLQFANGFQSITKKTYPLGFTFQGGVGYRWILLTTGYSVFPDKGKTIQQIEFGLMINL